MFSNLGSFFEKNCQNCGFSGGTVIKNLSANAGDARDAGLIPGLGKSSVVGNSKPLRYSCLQNSMNRETWWATVDRAEKSQTQLND